MRYIVFVVCSLVGFVIGHYLLTGAAAAFVSVIVSYHLFLAYLVVTAEKEAGVSLPVGQTAATHLAFLVVVVGVPYLRQYIPFFSIVQLFIPALAPFEADWLFSSSKNSEREENRPQASLSLPVEQLLQSATGEDHEAFLEYMRRPDRPFRKRGRAVREEYALWLGDRAKKKALATSGTARN